VSQVPSPGGAKESEKSKRMPPESTKLRIRRLQRSELPVETVSLARYLIGKILVHDLTEGRMSGRIVETEAYVVGDAAGHAFRGPTARNRALYLERGHAYVYLIYGSSYIMNVTSELAGIGAGVLLRALEPLEGIELMRQHRNSVVNLDLTRGPGRLASALRIDRRIDGIDLCKDKLLWLGELLTPRRIGPIRKSVRIGVMQEPDRKLRFYERWNPYVSGSKRFRN
jgi:DNA-3-methyladenine glycosylase